MGGSDEFLLFNDVLTRLGIDETKLKRLVSEGEIRAFRVAPGSCEMKFRRADVENLMLDMNPIQPEEISSQDTVQDEGEKPDDDCRATGCSKQAAVILAMISLATGAAIAFAR